MNLEIAAILILKLILVLRDRWLHKTKIDSSSASSSQQLQIQNLALQKSACDGLLQSQVLRGCTPGGRATPQNQFEFEIAAPSLEEIELEDLLHCLKQVWQIDLTIYKRPSLIRRTLVRMQGGGASIFIGVWRKMVFYCWAQ